METVVGQDEALGFEDGGERSMGGTEGAGNVGEPDGSSGGEDALLDQGSALQADHGNAAVLENAPIAFSISTGGFPDNPVQAHAAEHSPSVEGEPSAVGGIEERGRFVGEKEMIRLFLSAAR